MTEVTEVPIRRRTPGERRAYVQGYIAALSFGIECARDDAELRKKLATHRTFQQQALEQLGDAI